jgi:hypothetical protein
LKFRARSPVKLIAGEHGSEPGPQGVVATFRWDEATMPVPPGELASVWGRQFTVIPERAFGRWVWQDAPDDPPVEADARALVALAGEVHAALVAKDVDALLSLTALKSQELARALDVPVSEIDEGQRELFDGALRRPDVARGSLRSLAARGRPCAEGRMVRVTDASGAPPLVAATDERPLRSASLLQDIRVAGRSSGELRTVLVEASEQRRTKMADRETWLLGNITELRTSMTRAPYMGLGLLSVPLIGWRWGFAAAALAAFSIITLVCVALYVAWSHLQEYEGELTALHRKMKSLDETSAS